MHKPHPHPSGRAPSGGPDRRGERRRLRIVLVLTLGYAVAEIVGGLATGSLALLADAGHMLTDVASLGLALGALWMSGRPATIRHTYAYGRVEILVALVNGLFMWGVVVWIALEAVRRLAEEAPVDAVPMLVVASGGLVVNLIAYAILHHAGGAAERSLNLRGAGLHVLGDLLGSVGAMTAAIVIRLTGWTRADPLASLAIAILILLSSWRVVRDAVHVLLEGAPAGVDVGDLIETLRRVEGVAGVHDLHVWTITSGYPALSAHVVCDHGEARDMLLARLNRVLRERYGITHTTIQLEPETPPDHARPMARPVPTVE
ncbi:MAG TPA: cation diffusion facilitator family transporter [Gemmatimonadota bacterium]|nr:cation diffusion facilitator family transporter [Gemmatimonadota bacterium]